MASTWSTLSLAGRESTKSTSTSIVNPLPLTLFMPTFPNVLGNCQLCVATLRNARPATVNVILSMWITLSVEQVCRSMPVMLLEWLAVYQSRLNVTVPLARSNVPSITMYVWPPPIVTYWSRTRSVVIINVVMVVVE